MLHAKERHKESNEDRKTSAVFENLMLLPDDLFWMVICRACIGGDLPESVGCLNNYSFWPHWDKAGTQNKRFVEPDVFFRFDAIDVLVEAKAGEQDGQYLQQWEREVISYLNEYGEEQKPVVLIAVGGNESRVAEPLIVHGRQILVLTCSWLSLLIEVSKVYEQEEWDRYGNDGSIKRILENIILAFNVHGVFYVHWLGELCKQGKSMDSTMLDVRNAFRLLHDYQTSMLETVNYIQEHTCFARMYGRKRFSQPIHNCQGSPLGNYANLNVYGGMWAWDYLYGYVFEYYFGKLNIDGVVWNMSILQVSDDGFHCSTHDHASGNKLSTFLPTEDSHSYLILIVGTRLWPKQSEKITSEQMLTVFLRGEQDEVLLEDGDGHRSLIKRYPLEKFESQSSTDTIVKDYGSRLEKVLGVNVFVK